MSTQEALSTEATLRHWLDDFQSRFNSNHRAIKLSKKWNRQILVQSTDTGARHTLIIRDSALKEVVDGTPPNPDDDLAITLRATEDVLIRIFSGNYNPSTALLDGLLEVYSDARDKVKLEALAMVIWGL